MSRVSFMLTKSSLTVNYDGSTKVVAKEDPRFEQCIEAIRKKRLDDIPEIIDTEAKLRKAGVQVEQGLVMVEGEAMPSELNDRIMEYQAQKLPFESLKAFWENLRRNPSFNSRKQLFKFLENQGHPITEDGCFLGYRGVRDDFKDKHSGKFDNSPGAICRMDRNSVDDNPNNTCSHGLHVGGHKYAKDFGPKLVLVKVNPKDVVAVPNDYNGQKMRVCEFEVLREVQEIITLPVVSAKGEKIEEKPRAVATATVLVAKPKPVEMTPAEKRAHKRRYANNHAKRGKNGKFVSKKKRR